MVASLRILNEQNTVNKLMKVYNGTGYMDVSVNPWNEKIMLHNITNGKQFPPNYESGNLNLYDNKFVRPLSYEFDSDATTTVDDRLKYKKFKATGNFKKGYEQTFDNTMNMGPAFNMPLVLGYYGCHSCAAEATSSIKINK